MSGLAEFGHGHPVLRTPAIWHPQTPREGYGIVLFRRSFALEQAVRGVTLWVTGSERYILYLDGRLISRGPSRSDPARWGCVKVPLGTLKAGRHVLAALVAHRGEAAGMGQMGGPAFFLLHAEGKGMSELLDTGEGWRSWHDQSRSPVTKHEWGGQSLYYVVGAGERLDAAAVPWGWEAVEFDDAEWPEAKVVCSRVYDEWGNRPLGHMLRPDPLPAMEERPERMARVAEAPAEAREAAEAWLAGRGKLVVPPGASWRLVLDRGELTNAYPALKVSGGRGALIRMICAEAPYGEGRDKGNRDVTEGKRILGHLDEFLPDGGEHRELTTLWFRSFRYVQLDIQTAGEALTLESFTPVYSGYPLEKKASFAAAGETEKKLDKIMEISWRTARLCAHETFFDCPHYEQCQFPGDTRVQAIYHYLWADDDRLARKAIDDFHASRLEEGLTQCRYPSRGVQVIATFSLYWIGMLHDFRVYRGDAQFLARYMPFARDVLAWYGRRLRPDGLLGYVEHAPFIDWTEPFKSGNAPQDENGGSSILTMLFAEACGWQAGLERACGFPELAARWRRQSRALVAATLGCCWDETRGLLADTASKRSYSQHAQVGAILAGAWPIASARRILARAMGDVSVTRPGTYYYRYYVAQAMKACGMRGGFFDLLKCWEIMLEGTGLTTWPETDHNARSDCHGWSVTPDIEFLQTVLGVEPDPRVNGFARAIFRPELGLLPRAQGAIPTPRGPIRVKLERRGDGKTAAEVTTPVEMVVPGLRKAVKAGRSKLVL